MSEDIGQKLRPQDDWQGAEISRLGEVIRAQAARLAALERELAEKQRWIDDVVASCAKRGCHLKEYTAVTAMREQLVDAEARLTAVRAYVDGLEAETYVYVREDLRRLLDAAPPTPTYEWRLRLKPREDDRAE